jgi:hypothetical protein
MTRRMRSLLLGAALILPASNAYAVCTETDLTGKWRYIGIWFTVSDDRELMTMPLAVDCHLTLSSNRTVTVESCTGSDIKDTFIELFNGWQLELTQACGLRSLIDGRYNHRGQLSRDKLVLNGTVRANIDKGVVRGSFSLTKR